MKAIHLFLSLTLLATTTQAQRTQESPPDLSNKALITKATPAGRPTSESDDIAALRKLADDYYAWRNENYPVRSSDAGMHTWDNRLTDYSAAKVAERAEHVRALLDKVRAMKTDKWAKDDAHRLDSVPRATGADRVRQSHSQIGGEESAALRQRMQQRHLFAPQEGIRHAAESRARRDRALETDAGVAEAGPKQPIKPVQLYAQLAIASAALDRSAVQRKSDDAGE